jgi:hypothetical protein
MKRKPYPRRKRTATKSVLRLPDLEHAKAAVLNSLTSLNAQRGYRHVIDEFVAADYGLLSADLAAGIRRLKGVKKLGMRLGAGPSSLASTRSSTTKRKTRPSITSIDARVRLETA